MDVVGADRELTITVRRGALVAAVLFATCGCVVVCPTEPLNKTIRDALVRSCETTYVSTDRPLDVAIKGQGYFQIEGATSTYYTRRGEFTLNENREITTADGRHRLLPNITIPSDAVRITIEPNGSVVVTLPGGRQPETVGIVETAGFINPDGLEEVGEHIFAVTDAAGPAIVGTPGLEGRGLLQQRCLEELEESPFSDGRPSRAESPRDRE